MAVVEERQVFSNSYDPVHSPRSQGARVRHTVVIGGFDAEHLPHRGTLVSADDNQTAVEEERRLAYVGMTRARSELYLSVPAVTGHGARQRPTEPSPFLTEIPENLRTRTGNAYMSAGPLGPERPVFAV